jgi:thiol-disulfide isomerase/thioredoxin
MERAATTDAQGRYQIRVGPGTYSVQVHYEHLAGDKITDVYEWSPEHPASKSHQRSTVVQTITIKNEEELIHDLWIPKPETGPISGRVVVASDPARGVAGARVQGISMPPRWDAIFAGADGRFRAERRLEKTVVHARSPDGSLAGLVEISGDQSEIMIPVSPTASVTGIILDERGNPAANTEVSSERRMRMKNGHDDFNERFTPTITTDERGRFVLPELIVGQEYLITVPAADRSWHVVAYVKPQEAGQVELGTFQVGTGRSWPFRAGKPSVGDAAPSFAAQTLAGMPLKLEDFHGKFVLLDFWETGCAPCARDIPQLHAIQEAFGRDERFVMLTLSVDETIDAPRQFQEKRPLPGIQGFLGKGIDGAVPDSYGVRAIPALVLVGPDGKIVAKGMEGAEIQNAVARALK